MSKPTFENIDRWFFEYIEGNLSASQMEELQAFIDQHPELQEELEEWESARIVPTPTTVNTAHLLKRNPIHDILVPTLIGISVIGLLYLGYSSVYQPNSLYSKHALELSSVEHVLFQTSIKEEVATQQTVISNNKEVQLETNNTINTFEAGVNMIEQDNLDTNQDKNLNERKGPSQSEYEDEFKRQALSLRRSNHLPEVIIALNTTNRSSSKIKFTSKKVASPSTFSQFKRRFTNSLLKVKKMADQPVALTNFRDPHFHVPMQPGYQANFGMTGTLLRNRFQATSRNQWVGNNNQQLFNHLSWDTYAYQLRGGIGIDATYSSYGDGTLNNFELALTYSPKFSLSKNISLEPAVRIKKGAVNLNNNSSLIGSATEINRRNVSFLFPEGDTPNGNQLLYRDIGAGLLINTKWFYTGVNLDNIRRHYNNFYTTTINSTQRANLHFSGVAGTDFAPVGRDIKYSAYLFYQKYDNLNELWAGANVQWQFIEIGGGISTNMDLGSSIGLVLDQFSIHYNLDYLTSRLSNNQLLSHQFTMRYLLKPNRYAAKLLNL